MRSGGEVILPQPSKQWNPRPSRRNTINSSPGISCFRDKFHIWPQVILKGSWFPGKLREQTSDFTVKEASKKTQTHLPPRFCFLKKTLKVAYIPEL